MALAAAGRAKQQQIGTGLEPDIAGGECHHLSFRDRRYTVEVERGECLARGQAGFRHVSLDTTPAAIGDLMLRERRQEPRGGPAFLVRLCGELRPDRLYTR